MFQNKDDLCYQPMTDPAWQDIMEKYETVSVGVDQKVIVSHTNFGDAFSLGVAGISKASAYPATQRKLMTNACMAYYALNLEKRLM